MRKKEELILYSVYRLRDPLDCKVRYVGMTSNPFERFCDHVRCNKDNEEKNEWIQSLLARGYLPLMETIETTHNLGRALSREKYWIEHYAYLGTPLTNICGPASRGKKRLPLSAGEIFPLPQPLPQPDPQPEPQLEPRPIREPIPEVPWETKVARVSELYEQGVTQKLKLIADVWGAKPGDNKAYKLAGRELDIILSNMRQAS